VGDLLKILVVLTSVSRASETALSVLREIVNNDYQHTVLQLLKLPLSESSTYSLLKIIENLKSLGLLHMY